MTIRTPRDRLRTIWREMIRRCTDEKRPGFKNYGGRGIKVCDRWMDFEHFLSDMGFPPDGMMIERKDNDGHYSPFNCVWASRLAQNRNRRNVQIFTYNGESLCIAEWAERFGMKKGCLHRRLMILGMPFEEAISKPMRYSVWRRPKPAIMEEVIAQRAAA
jgi:hypothetical protein